MAAKMIYGADMFELERKIREAARKGWNFVSGSVQEIKSTTAGVVITSGYSASVEKGQGEQMMPDEIKELLEKYPGGFAVTPGGHIQKTVYATSHFSFVAQTYPLPPSNGGYLVVEMTDDKAEEACDEVSISEAAGS